MPSASTVLSSRGELVEFFVQDVARKKRRKQGKAMLTPVVWSVSAPRSHVYS